MVKYTILNKYKNIKDTGEYQTKMQTGYVQEKNQNFSDDIKQLSKWKDISYPDTKPEKWKIAHFSPKIYSSNTILIKMPVGFWELLSNVNQKVISKHEEERIAKEVKQLRNNKMEQEELLLCWTLIEKTDFYNKESMRKLE